MKLHLCSFGRLKAPGLREAADYWLRLARPWVEIEETELKPLSVPDKSEATRKQIQTREGDLLLERIDRLAGARAEIVLLDEGGKSTPTAEWAEMVRGFEREGVTPVFVIGSSLGFGETVRKRAKRKLSLGAQTLSHELARVVLIEQLYRAWSVVRGHPYHNEGT